MNLLGIILLLACSPTALIDFAIPRWKIDKAMRIDDAYKYLYQATRGGEHAAPSREAAKKWLDAEWKNLGDAMQNEPIWTPLCPDGSIGRLNLRPYRDQGGNADDLLTAFLQSASEYKTQPSTFTDAWSELGKRLKKNGFGKITHKAWRRFDTEMRKKNYPAVHHSEPYNRANRPAYRILTKDNFQALMRN